VFKQFEFDPGSGLTLITCFTHASHTLLISVAYG